MPVSRQRKLEIEKRRLKVAELALKGCRQLEIAERLGVTQATVSLDLKHLRDEWRQGARDDIAAEVARQLEKLSLLEREAWDAWERSKQPAHSTVVYRGGENEPSKMRQTLKHQTGDVRYLDQVQKCLAATRALLGLSPAREPLAGDAPHPPPSVDTINARRITLAEALPILLSDPSYHSAPPPPADHKPPNMIDVDAEYDRLTAEQRASEQLASDRRCKLEPPAGDASRPPA